MAYQRKTKDEFQLLCNCGEGWEYLLTEYTLKEANSQLKDYVENMPDYDYKIVKKRVPIQ